MSYLRLFLGSVLITAGVVTTIIFIDRDKSPQPKLVRIADGVYLSPQLQPESLNRVRRQARTIVDFRPDGEAKDQPSSETMAAESMQVGLHFYYIPVPHEGIPDSAVELLTNVLAAESDPVVLYCRTGRRAVKTFALVQASKPQGPGVDEIVKMVAKAGFSADDLRGAIEERIAKRPTPAEQ